MRWRERLINRAVLGVAGILCTFVLISVFDLNLTTFVQNVLADTGVIRPDADGTTGGTPVGCTNSLHYECLNEVVTQPTAPSTGSDYLQLVNTDQNFSQLSTVSDVETANTVTVWLYHRDGGSNAYATVGLYAADETTVYGGPTALSSQTSAGWSSVSFSGLSLTQSQVDGLRVKLDCEKTSGGKSNDCFFYALYADVTFDPVIEVTVGTSGTQQNLDAGATSAYLGGAFTITESVSSRNVTAIEIEENGTIDAANNLDNIKLFYDLDTTSPYDCASESYAGDEAQFGSTDTDGFSGANGTAAFSGSVNITTTQTMCVYTVLDIAASAAAGETIEVEINDPSVDVSVSAGDVEPVTTVALAGTTIIQAQDLDQIHYHWRNDDGNEAGATSATGGSEDSNLLTLSKQVPRRLRLEISNEGNKTADTIAEILDDFSTGNSKTISSGDRRLLLVGIHSEDSATNVDINTVTYGGQTLTEVTDEQITTTFSNGMWVGYLDEAGIQAAVGTTISPTWNGGTPDAAVLYSSVVFENVDQRNPVSAFSSNSGSLISTIQPVSSIAVTEGDAAVYFTVSGSGGQTHTPATGYTEGTEQDSGSVAANAYKLITANGTEQPIADWTNAQNRLAIVSLTVQSSDVYRLEYARKITTCSAATNWTDVGALGGDWDMYDSSNLTNGSDTTNIAVSTGGVTDENTTFLTPNGAVRDTSSYTGDITLTSSEFVEIEYSIEATTNATDGYTYCFRTTLDGVELDTYSKYPEATIVADVTVSSEGSQVASVNIPATDIHLGADIVIADNVSGTTTVNSVTLTASGTVDLQNDIDNLKIFYEFDTSNPYDCASESYGGTENQYGSTADGFSPTGTSTFTQSLDINTDQALCLYVTFDAASTVSDSETLDVFLDDASTDVVVGSGSVAPVATVDLAGETTFVTDVTTQVHYHWRNDDGNEAGATSATGGSEDTLLENLRRTTPIRLRIGVANEGSSSASPSQYRLEYALKTSVCSAATGWTDVNAADDAFNLFNSTNITDGDNTTNIAVSAGGVTDVGTTFLTPNGALKDTSSQTGSITLLGKNFVDLEYSLMASTSASEGATYCFRVTNAGAPIDSYDTYPEVSIKPKTDYFIQRGVTTVSGTSVTINAGTEYIAPSASTSAFIRIVGTNNVGAGSPTNTGNADDVTVYISNPWNITNNITFTRPATAVDTTEVYWEIIEYVGAPAGDNEIIVRQQQTATYGSGNTTVTTPTVSGVVDDNDVAVFVTGQLNPDTAKNYPYGLSTAAWNAGTDDATFTRGASGNAAGVSYAVVEFIGDNWRVQRTENTYTNAGTAETQSITAVNSLTRTFLHTQKRVGSGLNNHSDFGHNVYLSGIGQVTFELEANAASPASHTSVAWVFENTQAIGDSMVVTRSNGAESSGSSPKTVTSNIGATISDTKDASIFINNYANEANGGSQSDTFPEPIVAAEIISTTQYQTWIADPDGDTRTWRTEIVEWPTAARDITQNYYRFYVDNDSLIPTDPWPSGATDLGENTEITVDDEPLSFASTTRIRMSLNITSASMDAGIDNFKLQYAERVTTCSAIGEVDWHDLGDISSTTALWRGHAGAPVDGTALSFDPPTPGDLKISVSDVAGTYEEENPGALTPFDVDPGQDIEFDWSIEHNGAKDKTSYCFRMTEADGTLFDAYNNYPTLRTVGYEPLQKTWRWYDDADNLTPVTPLGNENVAPIDVGNQNEIKLRVTVREASGAPGTDTKFAVQYSEYSDFSQSVFTLTSTTTCSGDSLWCYADGAGEDNDQILNAVISDADTCTSGVGSGCGSSNESSDSSSATYDQPPFSTAEYEFTLKHAGARANAVYYFRLYDVVNDLSVPLDSGASYPSLVTEGAQLIFTVSGVDSNTSIAGIVTDATTSATTIGFGSLPLGSSVEAAQRLTVNTNATEGYQLFKYSTQQMTSQFGNEIPAIASSNAVPAGWSTACSDLAKGCSGYHTTDATLAGNSNRFAPIDSYAPLDTSLQEVMYNSFPVSNDQHDIVYRVKITNNQEVGDYTASLVYLVVPVF